MNLAAIFQVLQYFNDFEIIGYGGHFVFQNEAKIVHSKIFVDQDFPWAVFIHSEAVPAIGYDFLEVVFPSRTLGAMLKEI